MRPLFGFTSTLLTEHGKINKLFYEDFFVRVESAVAWKCFLQVTRTLLSKSWPSHFKTYYRPSSTLWLVWTCVKVKVKQTLYSPWQAFPGFQEVEQEVWLPISWQSAHEGGKDVSHRHRATLHSPPRAGNIPVTHFCQEAIVRPKRLCQLKFSTTPPGIEPATFRLVAVPQPTVPPRVPVLTFV
jgi:hypothetical protein